MRKILRNERGIIDAVGFILLVAVYYGIIFITIKEDVRKKEEYCKQQTNYEECMKTKGSWELTISSPPSNYNNTLLKPYKEDAFGYGTHSDATGRPFNWKTEDGQTSYGKVKPDAYGLGVGMDEFGRPVRAK